MAVPAFHVRARARARMRQEYRGQRAFSLGETRLVRDLVLRHRVDAFLSLHSGEQQVEPVVERMRDGGGVA